MTRSDSFRELPGLIEKLQIKSFLGGKEGKKYLDNQQTIYYTKKSFIRICAQGFIYSI